MKVAVFLPNWVGDVVMATPALRALRDTFADAELIGIMRPYVADVLAGTTLLDRSFFYNPRSRDPQCHSLPLIRRLRAEQLDTALLLTNSLRTAALAWMSGAKRRVGFARDWRGWLLTDRVVPRPRSQPTPVMDEYLRLTHHLGCPESPRPKLELAVRPEETAQLAAFWSGVSRSHPTGQGPAGYVCFNTGGAFGAAKNWPRESFAGLARHIVDRFGLGVLVVCGPAERDDARWIAAQVNHPDVVSLADAPLSLGLTRAAIAGARLLVTTDSGPRHFAAALGTPVVTLFGPTHIAWSETRYEASEHVQLKLDCGPCQKRDCPLGHHRCMRDLTVDQVAGAVERVLRRHGTVRKVA